MRRTRQLIRVVLVATLLALGPLVLVPRPAIACSCVAPQPLAQYARNGNVILVGRVEGQDERGVRVAVTRWFAGTGAAPTVWITGSFGDSASCGVGSEPAAGTDWIWVAWRSEGEPDLAISICTPTAMLDTDAGRELLAEANRAFGPGIGVEAPGTGQGATGAIDPVPWLAGTAAVLAGALVLVGVTIVARRPRA